MFPARLGRRREGWSRPPPLTPADGHHRCFWLRHRPKRAPCARRHRASTPVRRAACCADGFLWLSSRAFCDPAGGRICVVVGLDNKHGRSVEAIHSFLSRWKAGTELCAGTQQEPCGKKSSMGSENRQRCSPRFRKSALMRSVPPRFDRAARKTRRALAAFLRL